MLCFYLQYRSANNNALDRRMTNYMRVKVASVKRQSAYNRFVPQFRNRSNKEYVTMLQIKKIK